HLKLVDFNNKGEQHASLNQASLPLCRALVRLRQRFCRALNSVHGGRRCSKRRESLDLPLASALKSKVEPPFSDKCGNRPNSTVTRGGLCNSATFTCTSQGLTPDVNNRS
ncbi:MAG: hypothetical protein ACKPKO_48685, partial [Candidatus Fonsibacter sp.]